MQDAVLRELNDALARRGPAGAINFCDLDATVPTQRVGREEGLRPVARATDSATRRTEGVIRGWFGSRCPSFEVR